MSIKFHDQVNLASFLLSCKFAFKFCLISFLLTLLLKKADIQKIKSLRFHYENVPTSKYNYFYTNIMQ